MSGSTWRSEQRHGRAALEVAADEAVAGRAQLERGLWPRPRRPARRASWPARARRGCGARRARLRSRGSARRARRCSCRRCGRGAAAPRWSCGVREGRSPSSMRGSRGACAGARAAAGRSSGSSSRTWSSSHCTVHLAADPAGRRAVVGRLHLDAAVEVHRALAVAVVAKRLERQLAQARASPRQTSPRPAAWSCRGCACRPSAPPSDRGTPAPPRCVSKRSPFSGVFCAWPTPDSTLPLRSGSRTRHGSATTP